MQRPGPVAFAIDGKDDTAWGIDAGPGRRNVPRNAVFVPDRPLDFPNGVVLDFRPVDSAHLLAPRIRCESYFACAEIDKWASRELVETLRSALVAAGTPHRIEWYPKVEHGFVFPQRACYDKAAAERHWERLLALFGRTLR